MKEIIGVFVFFAICIFAIYISHTLSKFGEKLKDGWIKDILVIPYHSSRWRDGALSVLVGLIIGILGMFHGMLIDYPDKNLIQYTKSGEKIVCERFYFFWEPECGNWINPLPENVDYRLEVQGVVNQKVIFVSAKISASSTDEFYSVKERRNGNGSYLLGQIGNSVSFVFVDENKEKLLTIFEKSKKPLDESSKLFNEWLPKQKYFDPTGIKGEVIRFSVMPLFPKH